MTRFDFAAALAEQRERERPTARLFEPVAERVVLGALLCDHAIEDRPGFEPVPVSLLLLEEHDGRLVDAGITADLELEDFHDFRHRLVFAAWRNAIERHGRSPELLEVDDEVVRQLATRDIAPHGRVVDIEWLFDLATAPWPWGPTYQPITSTSWLVAALRRLRDASHRRRSL